MLQNAEKIKEYVAEKGEAVFVAYVTAPLVDSDILAQY